jgi:hypothetical protein
MKRFVVSVVVIIIALVLLAFLMNGSDIVPFIYRVF